MPLADTHANEATTVVLVQGAFADGSSWNKVILYLQATNLKVVSVLNPLTSLADEGAAAKRAIDAQSGPVVLVGFSFSRHRCQQQPSCSVLSRHR